MHKEDEKVILSISMMVSNSIDTIEKCMKGLQPILENVPSELIIVDTGGTDGSIEIARKYADLVVPFTWCNDFAKARNAGLEKVQGEWFLFIDDDECFGDTSEVIEFFNSGEYKEYGSASYYIRNYANPMETLWSDIRSPRFLQLTPQTKFSSPIHESIGPYFGKQKAFDVVAHHYGYVYFTPEERRAHFRRNVSLLIEELEKNPEDLRLQVQLCQEYNTVSEYEKSQELSESLIRDFQSDNARQRSLAGWLVVNVVRMELAKLNKDAAYEKAQEYFKLDWINTITGNNLCFYMIPLAFEKKEYEECFKWTDIYVRTYEHLDENDQKRLDQVILGQNSTISEEALCQVLMYQARAALKLGKKKEVEKAYAKLVEHKCFSISKEEQRDILNYLKDGKWNTKKEKLILYIADNEAALDGFIQAMNEVDLEDKEVIDMMRSIQRAFAQKKVDSIFQMLLMWSDKDEEHFVSSIPDYLRKQPNVFKLGKHVWKLLEENKVDLEECVDHFDLKVWKEQVDAFAYSSEVDVVSQAYYSLQYSKDSFPIKYLRMRCLDRMLRTVEADTSADEVQERLEEYVRTVLGVYQEIYTVSALSAEWSSFLPQEVRFALALQEIEKDEQKDVLEYLKKLRATVDLYPNMSNAIKVLLLDIRQKDMQKQKEADNAEFMELAEKVKATIKQYLASGMKKEALSIIAQAKTLLPKDQELMDLEKAANQL